MKKLLTIALGLCLLTGLAAGGDEGAWFDIPNCEVCKHMLTPEGMLDEIGWEQHLTKNGALSVTVVPAQYTENWAAAEAAMQAAGEKMMHGETMNLCNFCKSFGALMASGKMEMEKFDTIGGEVTLFSSDDAATVEAIHQHFKRNIHEMEKLMAEMSAGSR